VTLNADVSLDFVQKRALERPTNYARSLFHVASAATALTTTALVPSRGWLLVIAGSFATYAWSMELTRRVFPRWNDRLMRFYGPIAHAHEWYRVNSATWYATALVILALVGTRPATMAAVAVLGIADPMAALVGRRWGRHPLRSGRSLEGTLAFFASGTLASMAVLGALHTGPFGVLFGLWAAAGLAGALAELVSVKLDDNLTIPVAVGLALTALT